MARVLACRDTQRVGGTRSRAGLGFPRHGIADPGPPLAWLDPTMQLIRASRSSALRYERAAPGDLIHLRDVRHHGCRARILLAATVKSAA